MFKSVFVLAAFVALAAAPAMAATTAFTAQLSGQTDTSKTGSKATGAARIVVDIDKKTVDLTLVVKGLKVADLKDSLVKAPMGPIHLHNYLANGEVVLVLPAPYGPSYADTPAGFTVTIKNFDYQAASKLVNSSLPFEAFLKAMAEGQVVLNIHTNQFGDGEISGKVVAAS